MAKKKRAAGEGSIRKTPSGRWCADIMDGYTDDGKRNMRYLSADTKGELLDQIRNIRNNMDTNIHLDKSLIFTDWADRWYDDYKSQVAASTYSGYKYTLKLFKRAFGGRELAKILPIDINAFQDQLVEDGYSLSQIRKCRAMLIRIFDAADANGLVLRNPARKAKVLKAKNLPKKIKKKDAFKPGEVELLMALLPDDLTGNSIRLLLGTGMRAQELLSLTKNDITADGSQITINKAVKTVDGKAVLGDPKSELGNRVIPVPARYRPYAVYLREHGAAAYLWSQDKQGKLYGVGSFRRRYYTALSQVQGVRRLSPHCCRHTYVTRLQSNGVALETIAALVGHANVETTGEYLHIAPETLAKATDTLNDANDMKEAA